MSISDRDAQDAALLAVVRQATQAGDYWTASRAAELSSSNGAQARALVLVVRCAIEDKMYATATQMTNKIRGDNYRDQMNAEIIEARNPTAQGESISANRLNIEHLTCPVAPNEQ